MSTIALTYHSLQRKITSAHAIKINWKLVYFFAVVCSSLMLIYYIFNVNKLTQGAFLIKNYNKEIDTLVAKNRDLEISFTESNFLDQASTRAAEMSFQKTTNVKYIQVLQSTFAEVK